MQGMPCKNPNCSSCGKPHPHCRCFAMAKGGEIDPNDVQLDSPVNTEIPENDIQLDAQPEIRADDVQLDSNKYGSIGEQIKAGLEGAAQGLAGPLATLAETKLLGVKSEDIAGRAKANPWTHGIAEGATFAGSMLMGVGEAGLIAKGASAVTKAARLGKIGSTVLKGAIETASFTGADEITKALFNQPGSNPENPWSAAALHVGASGIMGALTGGVFGVGEALAGKGLAVLKNQKVIEATQKYLEKAAETGDPIGLRNKVNNVATGYVTGKIGFGINSIAGPQVAIATAPIIFKTLKPIVEKITDKPITKANSYVVDAFIKAASKNELSGLPNALHYATQIGKGVQKANNGIEALFKGIEGQIAEPVSESSKSFLKEFIEGGQVDQQTQNTMQSEAPQQYAKGGQVGTEQSTSNGFANIFPEQNILMSTAKGRISGYLNSIRPLPNGPKLPFDEHPSDKQKNKDYDRALDLAVNPLKILDHVNKGNLTPQDMKHFTQMWPEVHRYLSANLTKRIMKAQLDGEKPSYAKRQAMSLFLGAALDSSFTPQSIQVAQGVFAQKQAQQQNQIAPQKKKKGSLTKSANSYATDDQAREMRQQSLKV